MKTGTKKKTTALPSEDTFCERPWGHYFKFYQEAGVWVKRVEVLPGKRLSLQKHKHRTEKWVIVSGEGLVVINGKEIKVSSGDIVDVPEKAVHRIGNTGKKKLIFIEVACGALLSENDIERLQDDYARK